MTSSWTWALNPTTLSEGLLLEVTEIARKYKDRADMNKIPSTSVWTKEQKAGILKDKKLETAG